MAELYEARHVQTCDEDVGVGEGENNEQNLPQELSAACLLWTPASIR